MKNTGLYIYNFIHNRNQYTKKKAKYEIGDFSVLWISLKYNRGKACIDDKCGPYDWRQVWRDFDYRLKYAKPWGGLILFLLQIINQNWIVHQHVQVLYNASYTEVKWLDILNIHYQSKRKWCDFLPPDQVYRENKC